MAQLGNAYFLYYDQLDQLIGLLNQAHRCIGPQVVDDVIVYEALTDSNQLPWGIECEQTPGQYQLTKTAKKTVFNWANGAQAIKPQLFASRKVLWRVGRNEQGELEFKPVESPPEPLALFGVRPCDVRAMHIQDKVFDKGPYPDKDYQLKRKYCFIVVANCITSSTNCFCVSAGGSPGLDQGADIVLSEIPEKGFIFRAFSEAAHTVQSQLNLKLADAELIKKAQTYQTKAANQQTKTIPQTNLPQRLLDNVNHPHWGEIADRCLSCGNCTQVCPTCFCHRQDEQPDLEGKHSEHVRSWDSCFSQEHSYIHGWQVRDTTEKRYRQWLTHKFSTWHEQFDTSGCVGCGRCMTWCPVGIDVTEALNKLCETESDS